MFRNGACPKKDDTMDDLTIGFTAGVFDLFHIGHLNLLENCKKRCDYLIVAVCDDDYVRRTKNKDPVFPEQDRVRILSSLRCVDKVILIDKEETEDKMLVWNRYRFDVLFSGDDWKDSDRYIKTEKQFSEIGVRIEYLPYTEGISTTEIKKILDREN